MTAFREACLTYELTNAEYSAFYLSINMRMKYREIPYTVMITCLINFIQLDILKYIINHSNITINSTDVLSFALVDVQRSQQGIWW